MNDDQVEVFASIFAAQRVIGQASISARDELRNKQKEAMQKNRPPKFAATLREHYEPTREVDWSGRLIVAVVMVCVCAAWVITMTSDFRVMP